MPEAFPTVGASFSQSGHYPVDFMELRVSKVIRADRFSLACNGLLAFITSFVVFLYTIRMQETLIRQNVVCTTKQV